MNKLRTRMVCLIVLLFVPCRVVDALLGYTHVILGNALLESMKIEISNENRNAFLSGEVLADIGRMKYDDIMLKKHGKRLDSDSEAFILEMLKYTNTEKEKWFVCGFILHFIQDMYTSEFLERLFSNKKIGYLHYGIVDNYFREKNGTYIFSDLDKSEFLNSMNINEISELIKNYLNKGAEFGGLQLALNLFVNSPEFLQNIAVNMKLSGYFDQENLNKLIIVPQYELLQKTYESFGLKLSVDHLKKEASTLIAVSMLMATHSGDKEKDENFENNIKSCINSINEKTISFLFK